MRVIKLVAVALFASQLLFAKAVIQRSPAVTVGDADVQLVRNSNGLSVSGTVHGLNPGHTFTVWWIICNGPCLPPAPELVLNATGGLSNRNGDYTFGAGLPVGDYGEGPPRQVLRPGTLADPLGRNVVFHVLDHGPPIPGEIPEQISIVNGGCDTNPPPCPDLVAEIIFAP